MSWLVMGSIVTLGLSAVVLVLVIVDSYRRRTR